MVLEHAGDYGSQWGAINSIAGKIGCTAETLRRWVRVPRARARSSCVELRRALQGGEDAAAS